MLATVGCQTMTGRTAGRFIDDQTITAEVKSRLVADRVENLTRVGVDVKNGVVYLNGIVDSPDRAQRAIDIARSVEGVHSVVNQIQVASAPSAAPTVVTAPPVPTPVPAAPPVAPPAVTTAPAPTPAVVAGHPPVDVRGTVARYDPQTGIVTFQDGRMVKIPSAGSVWQRERATELQPGQHIYVRNAIPMGLASAQAAPGQWHFGTVSRVDPSAGVIYLTDGTAVQVQPSTRVSVNGQPISLSQVQPGVEVGVLMPSSTAATTNPYAATAPAAGYALPRSAGPANSTQILIFTAPGQ